MIQNFNEICKSKRIGGCIGCQYNHNTHMLDCAHEYYNAALIELKACENCDHAQFDMTCGANDCPEKDDVSLDANNCQFCKNYKHTFKGKENVDKK